MTLSFGLPLVKVNRISSKNHDETVSDVMFHAKQSVLIMKKIKWILTFFSC